MSSIIRFKDRGLAAVWELGLSGQFSDGWYEGHSAWEKNSDLLYDLVYAKVVISGTPGFYVDGEVKHSPLSAAKCYYGLCREGDSFKYHFAAYYAFGKKYGYNAAKKLLSGDGCYAIDALSIYCWDDWGDDRPDLQEWINDSSYMRRACKDLNKIVPVKSVVSYFLSLNRNALFNKLDSKIDEIDTSIGYFSRYWY